MGGSDPYNIMPKIIDLLDTLPGTFSVTAIIGPFFEELANANIWHKSPISAAEFLNSISSTPLTWWNDSKTQSARKMFIDQFAYGNKDWSEIWWAEMKGILKTWY